MTTQSFTIFISAYYRGTLEMCKGEKLYHAAEAFSISVVLEKLVQRCDCRKRTAHHSGKTFDMVAH
jgi:hypothetical protein